MKNLFAIALASVLLLGFTACSNWNVEVKEPEESSAPESQTETESTPEDIPGELTLSAKTVSGAWQFFPHPSSYLTPEETKYVLGDEEMVYLDEVKEKIAAAEDIQLQCAENPDHAGEIFTLTDEMSREVLKKLLEI